VGGLIMLDAREAAAMAAQFGVDDTQVRRDHLLSILLAALSEHAPDLVVFFGGTALARTHLPTGRLSEDIDLWSLGARQHVAAAVEQVLAGAARRDYGRLSWTPALTAVRNADAAVVVSPEGLAIRVQLLSSTGLSDWPVERRDLVQRYSDVASARLLVPTVGAFVASKTAAWFERRLPRDLYDMWGLARIGAINGEARELFRRLGPIGGSPPAWLFDDLPDDESWRVQLAAQTRIAVGPREAAMVVREAWAMASDS
jgi:predicted nucleotidyltransferase component of viral defense system